MNYTLHRNPDGILCQAGFIYSTNYTVLKPIYGFVTILRPSLYHIRRLLILRPRSQDIVILQLSGRFGNEKSDPFSPLFKIFMPAVRLVKYNNIVVTLKS